MKRLFALSGASVLTVSLLAATPALAGDDGNADIAAAAASMMTLTDAQTVGVTDAFVQEFSALSSTSTTTAANIWLCNLASGPVLVRGGREAYQREFASMVGAEQELAVQQNKHIYATSTAAARAFRAVKKAITQCTGRHRTEIGENDSVTVVLRNGTGMAAGERFHWISSKTVVANPDNGFEDDQYLTVRRVGTRAIQVMELDHEGPGVPAITYSQRRALERLTASLATRWQQTQG